MVQQSRIENTIISSLFFNEDYTRKVLPFVKEEYFGNRVEQLLFGEIFKFVEKSNNLILLDNKEFIDYIGDILLELLEEKLKDGTAIKDWKYNNI